MRFVVAAILLAALLCAQQDPPRAPVALTLDDVLKLVHAGVSEDIIVARIKRFNKPFDLNSDEILELKKSGVSDTIVKFLLDPTPPYIPPPPPPPPAEVKPVIVAPPPKDPLTLKVPPEPGIYWLAKAAPGNEVFQPLEMKPVVPLKRGGKMGSVLTGGLMKEHTVGLLAGQKAKVRLPAGVSVFYARFGAKGSADDLVLVRLAHGSGHRELDFGPKPDKPAFPPDSICQLEAIEAGPAIYRLSAPGLKAGEYLFFILGSGDEKKGVLGKGYDFGLP
jgi:hypothetical protein